MARPTNVLLIAIFCAFLGVFAALALGSGTAAADPELTLLIRFMAVLKAGMALAGAALAAWRLRFPASSRLAGGYATGVALMDARHDVAHRAARAREHVDRGIVIGARELLR